ncbi:MAG TPA: DotD/TraH family lipoprotein [Alphaproteobacteria bacterium]|nr:hypothetical protein [Rhodospirillaceae bacterium]HRJ12242.1 DotD/TraH family lipoprotein [Alphaproteobacteria bacterium]
MTLRNFFLLAMVLTLGACASKDFNWDWASSGSSDANPNERAYAAETDPVALRIAESADKASAALQDLARVEKTRRPPAPEPAITSAPDEMQQLVTVEWVGGAEALIRNLAARLNYDVVVVGAHPKVPVVVRVRQENRTIVEALRTIGEQATEFMDLVVNPAARSMEIRYKIPEPTRS